MPHFFHQCAPWAPWLLLVAMPALALPLGPEEGGTAKKLRAYLDSVPTIDTHDHLWPFDKLPGYVETDKGKGMNLASLWRNSYFSWVHPLTPWKEHDFADARATSFYRYQTVAFKDAIWRRFRPHQ